MTREEKQILTEWMSFVEHFLDHTDAACQLAGTRNELSNLRSRFEACGGNEK